MTDFASAGIFRDLDPMELQALRDIAEERIFPAGSRIFSENDPGDGMYLIREGLVEIAHLLGDRTLCVFSKFGPGDVFGEMAVVEDMPRSATTTAVKETTVCFFPRAQIIALLRRSPVLCLKLSQEISRRLREFNQQHLREIVEAERLSALGSFARSIVHDLKNPLTVIGMATEIIAAAKTGPERRQEAYERIKRQIRSITELVGDILEFTQASPAPKQFVALSYKEFIDDLAAELRLEAELRRAVLKFENEPPAVKLKFDARRIRRVIFNFVGNALDMTPEEGHITVRFDRRENAIFTEVLDNGPGIAPEIAGKLFQAFATFGKPHGTGLGLSICKKIVEDHGGRISARNLPPPAHGAIFSFSLPVGGT